MAGKTFETKVFDIKGEKLDTQIWFDQKTRMIVHQVLNKKGKWEYKLQEYNCGECCVCLMSLRLRLHFLDTKKSNLIHIY